MVSQSDVDVDRWQHWALTCDPATRTAVWYKNGQADKTYRGIAFGDMSSDAPLEIGSSQTWNGYYCGEMAEVKIYRRALTADEVQREYDSIRAQIVGRPAALSARILSAARLIESLTSA